MESSQTKVLYRLVLKLSSCYLPALCLFLPHLYSDSDISHSHEMLWNTKLGLDAAYVIAACCKQGIVQRIYGLFKEKVEQKGFGDQQVSAVSNNRRHGAKCNCFRLLHVSVQGMRIT